jgi:hypothetical protein
VSWPEAWHRTPLVQPQSVLAIRTSPLPPISSWRSGAARWLKLVLLTCTVSIARAEHCAAPSPVEAQDPGLNVALSTESATYRNSRYEGEYQGVAIRAGWAKHRVRLSVLLPAYRLARNGLEATGLGDIALGTAVTLARSTSAAFTAGAALDTSVPTGASDQDLGMGHVMLMPALWGTWMSRTRFLSAQVGVAHGLGASGAEHHHTGTPTPIVNPMNLSEASLAITGGIHFFEQLRLRSGGSLAAPLGRSEGTERASLFVGADVLLGARAALGFEGHVPITGDPFLTKFVAAANARF